MSHPEPSASIGPEPVAPQRTQEVIATLNVAAAELVSRIVRAERDVHDQRNAAFRAMNQAALLSDDVQRLRVALVTAHRLIEAAQELSPSGPLREELTRGIALLEDVLADSSASREC
ncbi:hypothetical protein [Tautonia plasticadhaerens]|uniref:Uncharacterized protein n=1 Tax=Tautonia plasticadhaerens TaxID=2527974 RepID=A0A518H2J4_9BACT|nr:hypothetical protein [Tautonia plasticadhaerens]QDV35044.1 hypothetical protein ElP_29430 [Tautonia plasticadhaerens]